MEYVQGVFQRSRFYFRPLLIIIIVIIIIIIIIDVLLIKFKLYGK